MNKIKIVFLGTPEFAIPSLKLLLEHPSIEVSFVVTQPDKPVGRNAVMTPPPIKMIAQQSNVTIIQPDNVNSDNVVDMVKAVDPDFIIVVAYGQILKDKWLSLAKKEILNLHASLLPKYRGASPIQSAILDGCEKTGVSVMGVRQKMDNGPVYAVREVIIGDKNAISLSEELARVGAELIIDAIINFGAFKQPMVQKDSDATYCKKIDRASGEISFANMDSDEIIRRYRAFYRWPGIFTRISGKRLILHEISKCSLSDFGKAGEVKFDNNKIYIQSKNGVLEISRLQLEGKKEMDAKSFIAGNGRFSSQVVE